MKHLIIGSILLVIGLSIFSPLDEIFIVLPLSLIFGAWIIPAAMTIALLCLGAGVYLIGSKHIPIPNPIAQHIWIFIAFGVMVGGYITYMMY